MATLTNNGELARPVGGKITSFFLSVSHLGSCDTAQTKKISGMPEMID